MQISRSPPLSQQGTGSRHVAGERQRPWRCFSTRTWAPRVFWCHPVKGDPRRSPSSRDQPVSRRDPAHVRRNREEAAGILRDIGGEADRGADEGWGLACADRQSRATKPKRRRTLLSPQPRAEHSAVAVALSRRGFLGAVNPHLHHPLSLPQSRCAFRQ